VRDPLGRHCRLRVHGGCLAEDHPSHGAVHEDALARAGDQPGEHEIDAERGEPGAHPQQERHVVDHDDHHVDGGLAADRGVRAEVERAVEDEAQAERDGVGHRDRDRRRPVQQAPEHAEQHQVHPEGEPVDQPEADEARRDHPRQPERQAGGNRGTQPRESVHPINSGEAG